MFRQYVGKHLRHASLGVKGRDCQACPRSSLDTPILDKEHAQRPEAAFASAIGSPPLPEVLALNWAVAAKAESCDIRKERLNAL